MTSDGLLEENKALRTRVLVLEQELSLRSEECAKLRAELHEFAQVKEQNESQREIIMTLRNELDVVRAAHVSAVEKLENIKKENREKSHREYIQSVNARLGASTPSSKIPALTTVPKGTAVGGIVPTTTGPEVICKSSDISSLGFSKVQRPVDFLGGLNNPTIYSNSAQEKEREEDEAAQLMAMVKDEVLMDIQFAEIANQEEKELHMRLDLLRRR